VPQRVTAGVLTWRSPRTLARTLASYRRHGLDDLLDQRLVLVQERGGEEARIARSFGWSPIVEEANIGIGAAYARLIEMTTSEYFLFLECDWRIVRDPREQLAASTSLLGTNGIEVVRLRSVERPGFPLGMLRFQNREDLHPEWLIECIFYEPEPWRVFPGVIAERVENGVPFAVASSAHASWTNNPHLVRTAFIQPLVRSWQDQLGNLETSIDAVWADLPVAVAHAPGLFTHSRVDGPAINVRGVRYHADQRFRWWTRRARRWHRRRATRATGSARH
jgi:hypothetical protein